MSARLVVVAGLVVATAGCYDIDALDRAAPVADGGASDGGGAPGSWRVVDSPVSASLRGVFGTSLDIFAVGASSTILRLAATGAPAVESAPPGFGLRAVWANSDGAVAVGDSGAILTRGAAGWSAVSLVDATFYAIAPASDPLVVGSGGTIMQHLSNSWMGEDAGVGVQLRGAFARPAGDVLVVGDAGTILHGTGGAAPLAWSAETSATGSDLYAAWASASDSFVVGSGGVVLHAGSGDVWSVEPSATNADLYGVFGAGDVVWAVGAGGTIIARRNGTWSVERTGGADLHAVWAASSDAWAVGDGGVVMHRTP